MRALALSLLLLPAAASAGVFPYKVQKKTLANGLDVVVIETPEFKDVLSYNTLVLAGSGREQEKGATGLAHLFEHILFRHRYGGVEGGYDDWMQKLGTDNNAWTWFDVTYFHPMTFSSNLEGKDGAPGLVDLEASRFSSLDISEKTFKTEAGAVLGEYRRVASFPSEKLSERLAGLLFPGHPYGHTTMGFYEDVVDMPNHYAAAKRFYDTFYRPNNCVVIVAGDVKAEQVFKAVEARYKGWTKQPIPALPLERGLPDQEQSAHVAWDSDVAPLVWVAYRMPAFSPGSKASAAAELLNELLVSPAAPLYRKLRYDKQSVSSLGLEEGSQGFESFAPRALVISGELYKDKLKERGAGYFVEVSSDIAAGLEDLKDFSRQAGAAKTLKVVKSKFRNDFLAQWTSPRSIAANFAWFYRFGRDPGALDKLLASVESLRPEDIDALARAQFVPDHRVVLTLSYDGAGENRVSLLFAALAALSGQASALETIALRSPAPLVELKVMVRAGSADDAPGLEGTSALAASLLIEGGFGDPKDPVTKEKLAELTRPWGSGAYPSAAVSKETTVFSFKVPRDAVRDYVDQVIRPMFNQPLFDAKELERLRGESLQALRSSLRLEQIENLGSVALDNVLFEGTSYAHPTLGTERGLSAVTREDALRFFRTYYQPERVVLGLSSDDRSMAGELEAAFRDFAPAPDALRLAAVEKPKPPEGRSALIVAVPNAIATGIHAGFPLDVTRKDPDYWPLYIANVWFGTHRDEFSHLYQVLREQRGYNYGDYSYIEHFEDGPDNLFPPPNHPYRYPAFTLWIRPVAHAYAAHVVRAVTWELENFIRGGLAPDQCRLAKKKARVMYLSLAETTDRLLASRLDDRFYGLDHPYLEGFLDKIDAVKCEEVNAAVARHLQARNLDYVIVTSEAEAPKIAEALASTAPVWGKGPSDYQIDVEQREGAKVLLVTEPKLELLELDSVWAREPLGLSMDRIRIVPASKLFATSALP